MRKSFPIALLAALLLFSQESIALSKPQTISRQSHRHPVKKGHYKPIKSYAAPIKIPAPGQVAKLHKAHTTDPLPALSGFHLLPEGFFGTQFSKDGNYILGTISGYPVIVDMQGNIVKQLSITNPTQDMFVASPFNGIRGLSLHGTICGTLMTQSSQGNLLCPVIWNDMDTDPIPVPTFFDNREGELTDIAANSSADLLIATGYTIDPISTATQAFLYSLSSEGPQIYPLPTDVGVSSRAMCVNMDGSIVGGQHGTQGAIWKLGEKSLLPGSNCAYAMTPTGSRLVGTNSSNTLFAAEVSSSEPNLVYSPLKTPTFPKITSGYAGTVSNDGRIMAGESAKNAETFGYIYTSEGGFMPLEHWLNIHQISIPSDVGKVLSVYDVSPNGNTFLGRTDMGNRCFIASIPTPVGENGQQGLPGPAGEQGERGPDGEQGNQGQQGPDGEQGDQGKPGIQGKDGEKGPDGDPGPEGEQGKKGKPGIQGIKGPDGYQGNRGPTGDQGATGPDGIPGKKGPKGLDGLQGQQGQQGQQGIPGTMGEMGDQGPDGFQGLPGLEGDPGDEGIAGAKGLQGAQGSPGDPGLEGPRGPQGPKGNTGAIGQEGPRGPQGLKGPQGAPGPVGPQGPAVTPVTLAQMNERLKQKRRKNLQTRGHIRSRMNPQNLRDLETKTAARFKHNNHQQVH